MNFATKLDAIYRRYKKNNVLYVQSNSNIIYYPFYARSSNPGYLFGEAFFVKGLL